MYKGGKRGYERENSHPEVIFESGKCIACGICVRIASEHSEELGLSFVGRGFAVRTTVPFNESLREGLRVAARACAEACPTGALTLGEWYDEMPERHDS
jgi:NADH dehydrogenase/NADH:ubiquinone oxidoreductase subunit G